MKAFAAKSILFLCTAISLLACNKEDDPAPVPVPTPEPEMHPVAKVLEGNYWQEKICFTYLEPFVFDVDNPDTDKGTEVKVTECDILDLIASGGSYIDARLNQFYIVPETLTVRVFSQAPYIGHWYHQNLYTIDFLDANHIRINTTNDISLYVGAALDTELKVMSCTDKEIILDGPIKSYVWQNWRLDRETDVMYVGIRVYWTKIENGAEILEPSSPLD